MICKTPALGLSYYLRKYDTSDYYRRTPRFVKNLLREVVKHGPYLDDTSRIKGNFVVPVEYLGRV